MLEHENARTVDYARLNHDLDMSSTVTGKMLYIYTFLSHQALPGAKAEIDFWGTGLTSESSHFSKWINCQ